MDISIRRDRAQTAEELNHSDATQLAQAERRYNRRVFNEKTMKRTVTAFALVLTQMIAFATLAQSTGELRAFGGEIKAIAKDTRTLSGSLGLTRSNGVLGDRYEATLGGSLAGDRLWFFASGSTFSGMDFGPRFQAVDASATAQPADWSSVTASFSRRPDAMFAMPQTSFTTVPSSFLSLRSTSILSESSVLNIGISRH